jgi:hypothetical protein
VWVTLVRQPETPVLEMGRQVLPRARAAEECLDGAAQLSEDHRRAPGSGGALPQRSTRSRAIWHCMTPPCVRHGMNGGFAPWDSRKPSLPSPPLPLRRQSPGCCARRAYRLSGPRPRGISPTRVGTADRWSKASVPACCAVEPRALPTKVIAARSSTRGWRSWHTRRQPGSASTSIVSRSGHARSADGCV